MNVQQRFQELSEILTDQYTEEDRQIVACPRAEQVSFHYRDFLNFSETFARITLKCKIKTILTINNALNKY